MSFVVAPETKRALKGGDIILVLAEKVMNGIIRSNSGNVGK